MRRSVNVELELEAGEYDVMVRVDANRYEGLLPVEEVIRNNVKRKREKLTRIGLAYDLAHGKGKVVETEEEKQAREAYDKKVKDKERREVKKKILESREEAHYLKTKKLLRDRKKRAKRKEKHKAKREAKEAKRAAKMNGHINGHSETDQANSITNEQEKASGDILKPVTTQPDAEDEKSAPIIPVIHPEGSSGEQKEKQSEQETEASLENKAKAKLEAQHSTVCESPSEDDESDYDSSLDSLSELSDRELDIQIESYRSQTRQPVIPIIAPTVVEERAPIDDFEKDPWNAVAVVGLRVYYKTTEGNTEEGIVKLKVVRPSPYSDNEEDDSEEAEMKEKHKGLDVDDSAKDATLEGGVKDRRKSIMGDQLKRS
jgi:hypothetical protein